MAKRRIVKANLDDVDCVVMKVCLPNERIDMLRAAHYSEIYVRPGGAPINEWTGRAVLERRQLALFVYTWRGLEREVGDLVFFAKTPEIRTESRHPEWGEPSGKHYAIPLSFPVSKVVLFAEELGHDDSGD